MKETNNLKKEPSKMKELWEDFRDGFLGFTLVFAGICAVIVGMFAYTFLVYALNEDVGENLSLILILSIVAVFLFIVLIAMLKTTLSSAKAKLATIIQISLTVITIISIIITCALPFIVIGTTFEEGDFSETQTCSRFAGRASLACTEPANGGRTISRYGLSKEDVEIEYYCAEHFVVMQELINSDNEEDKNKIDDYDVWQAAMDIVRGRLKAPSTAEFCSRSSAIITQSGKTWTIKGYVDAENSFGAMIRNDFCVVLVFESDTRYTISECTIKAR